MNIDELNSYIIKTATLSVSRDFPNLDWSHDQLGCRVIDVLKYICLALQECKLPNLFVKGHNLLQHLKDIPRENMMAYLKKIIKQKSKFDNALEGGVVYTLHLESAGLKRAKTEYVSWPRMNEVVSVNYILREGERFRRKLRAEGMLKQEGSSCFQIFKYILTVFFFILLAILFHYVRE